MEDIARLSALSASVHQLRELLGQLEDLRADAVHELTVKGIRPVFIIEAAGMTRSMYYRTLDRPRMVRTNELEHHEDWDSYQMKLEEFEIEFEAAWEYAVDEWHSHHEEGGPEDYFPLSNLVPKIVRDE